MEAVGDDLSRRLIVPHSRNDPKLRWQIIPYGGENGFLRSLRSVEMTRMRLDSIIPIHP